MKQLILLAALGVAGCTTAKVVETTANVAPPPVVTAAIDLPNTNLLPAMPGPWRITKTEWTKADEEGFGEFVRRIAESGCTMTTACMETAANFYHDSDPPSLHFHADCGKWAYMLRAYYASKNGLPFSYVDLVAGSAPDLRYGTTPNVALERHDVIDSGSGIDTVAELQNIHDKVYTATFRMDPASQVPVEQDFYSPKIRPGSIHAGTTIYDITGHVVIVYDVTADGSILYMSAHPDESVSRGVYGREVPPSPAWLGGGFKNFRPLKLVDAMLGADGNYIGGHIVMASNEAIADFSLEQYQGNTLGAKGSDPAPFRYNNAPLDSYEYTRAAMSNGGFAFNPVYELEVRMDSLCQAAKEGTPEAQARMKSGFASLYADLSKAAALWEQRDLRVVYHGTSLRQSLVDTYAAEEHACVIGGSGHDEEIAVISLDQFARQSPETDLPMLFSRIDDFPPFVAMRPVGN